MVLPVAVVPPARTSRCTNKKRSDNDAVDVAVTTDGTFFYFGSVWNDDDDDDEFIERSFDVFAVVVVVVFSLPQYHAVLFSGTIQ